MIPRLRAAAWMLVLAFALPLASCGTPTVVAPGEAMPSPGMTPSLAAVPTLALTPAPSPAPATATPMLSATATSAPEPQAPTVHPTNSPTPAPGATLEPSPAVEAGLPPLLAPLAIDGEAGRIYAATNSGEGYPMSTAVLSTRGGEVLGVLNQAGKLALDTVHHRLYVDQGDEGLAVLDSRTGTWQRAIELPPLPPDSTAGPVAPQADPATGQVFAMRDNAVYAVDPDAGEVRVLAEFDMRPQDNCQQPHDALLPITGSQYDPDRRILYLTFVTYFCTPWVGETIVAYDVGAGAEIGTGGGSYLVTAAGDGRLYASSWYRMGVGTLWMLRDGLPGATSTDWNGLVHGCMQIDTARERLLVGSGAFLGAFDLDDMAMDYGVTLPRRGCVAGFDPVTDQLFFLDEGHLWQYPAQMVEPPQPAVPAVVAAPAKPVVRLAVSADWPVDQSLAGLWGSDMTTDDCYVFGQSGGAILLSADGGATWRAGEAGLPAGCTAASALALSPDYARDGTLLAGIAGMGVFKSVDGAALWVPASRGLASMGILGLWVSPGFAEDGTAFAQARTGAVHRTADGGSSWQALAVTPGLLAMSPEFDQDRTLVAYVPGYDRPAELWTSTDGGDQWSQQAAPAQLDGAVMLSAAPLYSRWRVLFVINGTGTLLRSDDGGASWREVLATGPQSLQGQIVYAPDVEANRPVFLMTRNFGDDPAPELVAGRLFRSLDGGVTWQELALEDGVVPTALAISPSFTTDGLIFVGTADGRVLALQGLALPLRSAG